MRSFLNPISRCLLRLSHHTTSTTWIKLINTDHYTSSLRLNTDQNCLSCSTLIRNSVNQYSPHFLFYFDGVYFLSKLSGFCPHPSVIPNYCNSTQVFFLQFLLWIVFRYRGIISLASYLLSSSFPLLKFYLRCPFFLEDPPLLNSLSVLVNASFVHVFQGIEKTCSLLSKLHLL